MIAAPIALQARTSVKGPAQTRRPAGSRPQTLLRAQPPHKSHFGGTGGGVHHPHHQVDEVEECYYDSDFESPVLSADASTSMRSHPPAPCGNPGSYGLYEHEVGDVLEKLVTERWAMEDKEA